MDAVQVGSGRDVAGAPLPTGSEPVPAAVVAAEQVVMTAFLTRHGDLVVDEWCDPLLAEVGGVALEMRAATARQALADAHLVRSYLWGAAELAHRSGAPTERERREWGARGMLAELAVALRLPESTLARKLARLTRLDALPLLRDAHRRGAVSSWHVDVVLDVFRGVTDPAVLSRADEFLADRAGRLTAPELRACARGWRSRHVPRTDEERRRNLSDRRVDVTPADDDLCWLTALLPAAQAMAIDHRLDQLAAVAKGADDDRSHDEVRADALVDLLLGAGCAAVDGSGADRGDPVVDGGAAVAGDGHDSLDGAAGRARAAGECQRPGTAVSRGAGASSEAFDPGDQGMADDPSDQGMADGPVPEWVFGVRPEVVLTVPVLSLLGHSDEPAELDGFGPIDIDTARMLAAHAPSFVRVLTHPETGAVLSVGRDRYRVPEDLKRAVQLRDRTCRFPDCRRRARGCDIDHSRTWADGGGTELCNLECLCRKHHRLKHEMRWAVAHEPDGSLRWRSPVGLTYWTQPGGVWPPRPAPPPHRQVDPVPVATLTGYPDTPPF